MVKKGFSFERIKLLDKIKRGAWLNAKRKRKVLDGRSELVEPVVVRQLLNPLLWHGNNICTLSVYVFVESFETLRSYIFNNVKVRFRQQNGYVEDSDFNQSGFGKGKTLYRFTFEELIKLLHRRDGSQAETTEE